jgi:diguanylate cyclase (GGDEF)-like protein
MQLAHPKLIDIVVDQTPKAMLAILVVSLAYFFMFIQFIPLPLLLTWLVIQVFLAHRRIINGQRFKTNMTFYNEAQIKKTQIHLIGIILLQATMWAISSVMVMIYAPHPFEFVMFIVVIAIITAATLSMSSLYHVYLVYILAMVIPQMMIMAYYGDVQHIALIMFILIYIPAIILLSKSMLNNRISSIQAHEELAATTEKFRQLSITDKLTNIYNRRYFFEMSHNLLLIAAREKKHATLLMLDVDYFKQVNDRYGHQAGDHVLVELSKLIKNLLRKSDLLARIGGEEFAILLNDTSLIQSKTIAEKLRVLIANTPIIHNGITIHTTISIGLAEVNSENTDIEHLYKQADKQLYIAKNAGRNKVAA